MTLPGADTIKGGIMGDDCLRSNRGLPLVVVVVVEDIADVSCAGMVSTGDCSGVCVPCDLEVGS